MRCAELALYEAKSAGRRTWRMFDPAEARGCTDIPEYPLGQPIPSAEIDAFLTQHVLGPDKVSTTG
jgi:hypothetical protein